MRGLQANIKRMAKALIIVLLGFIMVPPVKPQPAMSDYCYVPPFVGTSVPPNVMIMLSIETPMQGAAHPDVSCTGNPRTSYSCSPASCVSNGISNCYNNNIKYYGYFDPDKCYTYNNGVFVPSGNANNHQCSNAWSGNFLNWATTMAVDAMRKAFTGGNRIEDTPTRTVLLGARQTLPMRHGWFPVKRIDNASPYTPYNGRIFIIRYSNGFVLCRDKNNNQNPDCSVSGDNPGENSMPTGSGSEYVASFVLKIEVCNPNRGLESNCMAYRSGSSIVYKPVGILQKYADRMRFGLISYAIKNNPDIARDGGIIRANMKWISTKIPYGMRYHDANGNLLTCNNPNGCDNPVKEIEENGILTNNPHRISNGNSGIINYINKFGYLMGYKSYDPISEMYYQIIRYFRNQGPTSDRVCSGLDNIDDGFPVYCNQSSQLRWLDPYIYPCQKSFVIAINDANPWMDKRIPGTAFTSPYPGYDTTANDYGQPDSSLDVSEWTRRVGNDEGITPGNMCIGCVLGGTCDWQATQKYVTDLSRVAGTCPWTPKQNSYYIAGLSYYAHNTDLRTDLSGNQNLTTYMIDTQEANPNMLVGRYNMLYLAAKFGGFDDQNGNGRPDLTTEWDKDNDGFPDNYFFASDPTKIEEGLTKAFSDILRRASSGATVATLASRTSISSVVLQPYFYPRYIKQDGTEISWIGFLRSFWVDTKQNLREDTNTNKILEMAGAVFDKIFQFVFDSNANETKVAILSGSDPDAPNSCSMESLRSVNDLKPLFDAGCRLAVENASDRRIYYNKDGTLREFTTGEAGNIRNIWQSIESSVNDNTRASCIIRYIRGEKVSSDTNCSIVRNLVNRIREFDATSLSNICPTYSASGERTWKLGDIIYSTPSLVSAEPLNIYHLRYNDSSYLEYIRRNQYRNRASVAFIGANDGMLHAFRIGSIKERRVCSNNTNLECSRDSDCPGGYCIPNQNSPVKLTNAPNDNGTNFIAREEWAFIPRNALPYLVWYGRQDYCHVPTVDYRTIVVDASIGGQSSEIRTADSWRTVLIGTMGFGGKEIRVGGNTYSSSIFALDLTEWLSGTSNRPTLRWETSIPDNTLALSFPAIVRLGDPSRNGDWYVVVGTGPKEAGDKPGTGGTESYASPTKLYFINLRDGNVEKEITISLPSGVRAAVGDIMPFDVDNDYRDDVLYFGLYGRDNNGNSWGNFYRLPLRSGNTYKTVASLGATDISIAVNLSDFNTDSHRPPVFGAPTATKDEMSKVWVFFGTGKFLSSIDKILPYDNFLIGFKDDCWNGTCSTSYTKANMTNTTGINISATVSEVKNMCRCSSQGCGLESVVTNTRYTGTLNEVERGWYYSVGREAIYASPIIFGGIVDALTFVPPGDICQMEGTSNLLALYYKTGTPYPRPAVLSPNAVSGDRRVGSNVQVRGHIFAGQGVPPIGNPFQTSVPAGQNVQYEKFVQLSSGLIMKIPQQAATESQGRFILWIEK